MVSPLSSYLSSLLFLLRLITSSLHSPLIIRPLIFPSPLYSSSFVILVSFPLCSSVFSLTVSPFLPHHHSSPPFLSFVLFHPSLSLFDQFSLATLLDVWKYTHTSTRRLLPISLHSLQWSKTYCVSATTAITAPWFIFVDFGLCIPNAKPCVPSALLAPIITSDVFPFPSIRIIPDTCWGHQPKQKAINSFLTLSGWLGWCVFEPGLEHNIKTLGGCYCLVTQCHGIKIQLFCSSQRL